MVAELTVYIDQCNCILQQFYHFFERKEGYRLTTYRDRTAPAPRRECSIRGIGVEVGGSRAVHHIRADCVATRPATS
jgi:hypothetical protein